jgi:hypothetical protein
MDKLHDKSKLLTYIGNWDWQPHKLKEQFGQLLFKDVKFDNGKEKDLIYRIGSRLKKTPTEVINILKRL